MTLMLEPVNGSFRHTQMKKNRASNETRRNIALRPSLRDDTLSLSS